MVYLKNLNSQINYTYKKAKVTRYDKGNLVQILNFLDANVVLNSKNEISPDVYHKDANTHMTVLIQNLARKTYLITQPKELLFL